MMGRVEKRIFIGVLAVLVLALGAMALQRMFSSDAPTIYHVSVLLDGAGEDYWQNFRRGVDRAAREHNVDVRFLSRYEGEAGPAQVEALRREWEGETDAVVLIPIDGELLAQGLQKAPSDLAAAVAGPALESDRVSCYISADPEEMGRMLADALAADGVGACTVFLSREGVEAAARRYRGLSQRLRELGIACEHITVDLEEEFDLPAGRAAVALEPGMTETLCRKADAVSRVYGVGASNRLLHYMEEGLVKALVVQSDYDAGYLSLLSVLEALEGKQPEGRTLDSYTVTLENLFSDPMDQILFPVS